MEVTQLTKEYSAIHCSPNELEEDSSLLGSLINLYRQVFCKDKIFVSELMKWHQAIPGSTHYFFGVQNGTVVAFNCFTRLMGPSGFSYALSGGSMVLPTHKGSFVPLFQYSQNIMTNYTDFLMGFCNDRSVRVLCHPVIGWSCSPSFKQIHLISSKIESGEKNLYTEYSGDFVFPNSLVEFDRTKAFLGWRLSRNNQYRVIFNKYSKKAVIYKIFEKSADVISILGCVDENEYGNELSWFLNYVRELNNIQGVNLFLSSEKLFYYLQDHFNFVNMDYPRHFCYRRIANMEPGKQLFLEMIDSDTF